MCFLTEEKCLIGEIRETEDKIKELQARYEAEKSILEKDLINLKVRLADRILAENNKVENTGDVLTLVSVAFKPDGKTYDYIWDFKNSKNPPVVGGTAFVPSKWKNEEQEVTIVNIFHRFLSDIGDTEFYRFAHD